MAARKRHDIDPIKAAKLAQQEDRVRRARMASPPRNAEHYERCAELARECGIEPCDVMDDYDHAASIAEYEGNVSRERAEALAMEQMLDRYTVQRRLA